MRAKHGLLTLVAVLLGVAACGGSRSEPARVRAGGLQIQASLAPSEGRVGANQIWVELQDAQGRSVTGADVGVKVYMHAMGAMPAMGGSASVTPMGDGQYRADFNLEMGGTWLVEIQAQPQGGQMAWVEGSLTVGTPGLRLRGDGANAAEAERPAEEPPAGRHPAETRFEPERLQRVGVRTGVAERAEIGRAVRAIGRVAYDETALVDVALKVRGWVEVLHADALGLRVERGDVLLELYSPELYAAQEEFLQARRLHGISAEFVRAARNRLRLWDVAPADIDRMARAGAPLERVPVRAPATGFLIEKNVVAGSAVEPGQRLFRIAPLDRVWIEADLYENELELARVGQPVHVTLSYLPERSYHSTVSYVYPYLTGATRTARVRIALANPELELRPDMYVNVELVAQPHSATVVPESAVLYAGSRRFVFLDLGGGRFRPQEVEVGLRQGERVEILSGLAPGQRIVTSGTFLIASESRLRAALEQW